MALFSGTRGFLLGFATGFGTGWVTHEYFPGIRSIATPALRQMLRAGMFFSERSKEAATRFGELLQDTMAEVKLELKDRRMKKRTPVKHKAVPKRGARKRHAAEAGAKIVDLEAARRSTT